MKYIATIMMSLLLPFTFAGTAEARHLDGYVKSGHVCMKDGDTRYGFVIKNKTDRNRFMNWSQSRTSDGATFGFNVVNQQTTFFVRVPSGETSTVRAWTRLNQNTRIFKETLKGVCK